MKRPMRMYRLSVESALTPVGAISAGGGSGRVAIEGFLQRSGSALTALGYHSLGIGNRTRRVEPFGTGLGAIHDGVAAIETERVLEPVEALAGTLIAAVGEPAIGLQQDRRAEILVLVPPITRAGGRAAEAEDALPDDIE